MKVNFRPFPVSNVLRRGKSKTSKVSEYLTYFEGVVFDGFDNIFEEHFGCERMAMVNNRFSISPVPTVQLHASATLHQRSASKENIHDQLVILHP